jgi:phage shock protein PspC (stress-responsive transcriptional regulator)
MNRRLYRSPDDRILAGVAGGMAETYDLDPALVRVGWAFLILVTGGLFLLLYIVMTFVVPLRPYGYMPGTTTAQEPASSDGPMTGPDGQPIAPPPGPPAGPFGADYYRRPREHRDGSAALVFGVLLIFVGGYFLVREYIPAINFDLLWPVIVIAGGALLVIAAMTRQRRVL